MALPAKLYTVDLSQAEREAFAGLTPKGPVAARKMQRGQILLKANEGWRDRDITAALDRAVATVERTRRRCVEGGLARALNEDARPGQPRRLAGRVAAYWLAVVCSTQPASQARWRLGLLADTLVELAVVDSVSYETVRQTLKKMTSTPGK